jgi:hypothetical protein
MSGQTTETTPETSDSLNNEFSPADESATISDPRDDQDDSLSWVDESSSEELPVDESATVADPRKDKDSSRNAAQVGEAVRDESFPDYAPEMLGLDVDDPNSSYAPVPAGHTNLPTSITISNTPLPPPTQEDADFLLAQQLQAEFDAESAQSFCIEQPLANSYFVHANDDNGHERLDKGGKTLKDI